MAKIKIENELYNRMKEYVEANGYSSVEEFVTHVIEKEIEGISDEESEEKMKSVLRGLGYLE